MDNNSLTLQGMFDFGVAHLRSQGLPSINPETGKCMYRYGEMKCGAGCFIKDEDYNVEFEGKNIMCGAFYDIYEKYGWNNTVVNLLYDFQCIHDSAKNYTVKSDCRQVWEPQLKNLAFKIDLVYKEPTEKDYV